MLPLNWLLNLFNTFSLTNHHNLALSVALVILILHRRIFVAQTALHRTVTLLLQNIKQCKKDRLKEVAVPVLFVALIILASLAPAPVKLPQNSPPALFLAPPAQDYTLLAIASRAGSELKEATTGTSVIRRILSKAPALMPSRIANSQVAENLTRTTSFIIPSNLIAASWLQYACQLLDLPPPCFS